MVVVVIMRRGINVGGGLIRISNLQRIRFCVRIGILIVILD